MDPDVLPASRLSSEEDLMLPTLSNRRAASRSWSHFDCQHCSKSFLTREECLEHEGLHFRERKFECPICNKTFLKQAHLREHARIHSGERPFQCDLCPLDFMTSGALFAHKLSYHPESLFYCSNCDKKFQKKSSLDLHKCGPRKRIVRAQPLKVAPAKERFQPILPKNRVNSRHSIHPLPYRCNICDKRFFAPKSVVRHKQIYHAHHKPKTMLVLPNRVKSMIALASSKVAASKVKKGSKYKSVKSGHKCPTCGMGFRVPSVLQRHMKTHTGEDTFSCHICGKKIRRFDGLQSHMRQHTGNAIHTCLHCDKTFETIIRLRRHMKSVHGKVPESVMRCEICSKFFVNELDLNRHMELGIHAIRDQAMKDEMNEEEEEEEEEEEMEEDGDNDESSSVIIEINTDPGFLGMEDEGPDTEEVQDKEELELAQPSDSGQIEGSVEDDMAGCRDSNASGVAYEKSKECQPASIAVVKQEPDPEGIYSSDLEAMKADLVDNEGNISTDMNDDDSLISPAVVKGEALNYGLDLSSKCSGEMEGTSKNAGISKSEPSTHFTLEEGEIVKTDNDLEDCFWVDYTHTGTKKGTRYICKFCEKQFRDVTQVRDHSWVHTGVKRHRCNLCSKDFTASCSLRVHLRNVHPEVELPDGRFTKQDDTPPKKPGSSSCQSTTSSQTSACSLLTRRQSREMAEEERKRVETEVKAEAIPGPQKGGSQAPRTKGQRIKCLHCPKTFIDMTHLRNHMWVHTGVKLHKCIVCGKEFSTSGSLNVHKKSAHTEEQIIMAETNIDWEKLSSSNDPMDQISRQSSYADPSEGYTASVNLGTEYSEDLDTRNDGEDEDDNDDGDDDNDDDDCFQLLAAEEERIEEGDEGDRYVLETEEAEDNPVDCLDTTTNLHNGYQSEESLISREDDEHSTSTHSIAGQELPPNMDEDTWQTVHIPGRKSRVGCPYCDKTFCDKANLRNHLWVHTGVKLHQCLYCSKTFTTSSSLHVHMRRSHDRHRFIDPVTGEIKYVSKKELTRIQLTSQADSSRNAQHKEDSLHSLSSNHALPHSVHHGGADPVDTGCSQSTTSRFSQNTGDSDDSGSLASEPGTSSELIGTSSRQAFTSVRKLLTANSRKSHDLHYERERVGASFIRRSSTDSQRRRSRSLKQRIGCTLCAKTFSTMSHLRNHMWVHTGVKLHQCKICNKEFTTANSVKVHMRSMHSPTEVERVKDMSTQNPNAKRRGDKSNSSFSSDQEDDVDEGSFSDGFGEIALSEEECEVDGVISLEGENCGEECSAGSDLESSQNDCSDLSDTRYMQIMNPTLSDEEEPKRQRQKMLVKLERNLLLEDKVKRELSDSPQEDKSHVSGERDEAEGNLVGENTREGIDDLGTGKGGKMLIACRICKKTFSHRFSLKKHMAVHIRDKSRSARATAAIAQDGNGATTSMGLVPGTSEEAEIYDGKEADMHQFESDYNNANSPFTSENPGEPNLSNSETGGGGHEWDDSHHSTSCGSTEVSGGGSCRRGQVAGKSGGGGRDTGDHSLKRVKKFKCEHCNKEFINKTDCQDHMWQHTGIKRHACPICQARFVSSGGLKAHFLKIHVDNYESDDEKDPPMNRPQKMEPTLQSETGKGSSTGVMSAPKRRLLGPKCARNRQQLAVKRSLAGSQRASPTTSVFQQVDSAEVGSEEDGDEACMDEPASQDGDQMAELGTDIMDSFDCCICGENFASLEELDNHMLGHPLD